MTKNERLQNAIDAVWKLGDVLSLNKILEITGYLTGKKEPE